MNLIALGIAVFLAAVSAWLFFKPRRRPPEIGEAAPDYTLTDQHGVRHGPEEDAGSWRALCFYPRDDTPGCTREACALRDGYADLAQRGVKVYGVSTDSAARHAAFAARHALPYPLLADADGKVALRWGVRAGFGALVFARRASFLIAPDGRVAARWLRVDTSRHAEEIAVALTRLAPERARDRGN